MADVTITQRTLIPLSLAGAVFGGGFLISGFVKDVEALGANLEQLKTERSSLEAEIITQLQSQAHTLQEIERHTAVLDGKLSLLLKLEKRHD